MRRARYQNGTVELSPRSHGPAVWVYRWREESPQGKSIRKSMVIGNADKFKTRTQALKAADGCRMKASRQSEEARGSTFDALIESYITEERLREAKDRAPGISAVESDEEFDAEALSYSIAVLTFPCWMSTSGRGGRNAPSRK